MDIFKQNRFLGWTLVALVALNLVTLAMLWSGRPRRPGRPDANAGPDNRPPQEARILRDELGFDESQIEKYRSLTRKHREDVKRLNDDIRRIKKRMFDGVLQDNPQPELSEALLAQAQAKQAEIEKLTFQYFLDLKAMCRSDQQQKLKLLMDEIFRGAPAGRNDGRPQPPQDRQPPPRRPPGQR
jgi:hypothetical protein